MISALNKNTIGFLFWLSICLFLLRAVDGSMFFQAAALISGIMLFTLLVILNGFKVDIRVGVLLLLAFYMYGVSLVVNGLRAGSNFYPFVIACVGVAIVLLYYPPKHWMVVAVFCLFIFYFLFRILIEGAPANSLIKGSRNQISVLAINLGVFVYISIVQNDKPVSIWPAFLVLIVSLICIGFMGILSSLLLFLGVAYCKFFANYNSSKFFLLVLAIFFFVLIFRVDINLVSFYLESVGAELGLPTDALTKLDLMRYLGEDTRFLIWSAYFEDSNLTNFLFGRGLSIDYAGFKNPHNAYIMLHSRSGVLVFLVFAFLLVALVKLYIRNLLLFFCLLSLMMRALADTTMLGVSVYDWILYYLVFYAYWPKDKLRLNSNQFPGVEDGNIKF